MKGIDVEHNHERLWQCTFKNQNTGRFSDADGQKRASRLSTWLPAFLDHPFLSQRFSVAQMKHLETTSKQTTILATFLPDIIIYKQKDRGGRAVLLLADMTGFTILCEKHTAAGRSGTYRLTSVLNGCLGPIVQVIYSYGGDVLKFSGDALLAYWHVEDDQGFSSAVHRVMTCALYIQNSLGSYTTSAKVDLRVKVAIAAGPVQICVIGMEHRRHYIITGKPVQDVNGSEKHCKPGEVVVSASAWAYCSPQNYVHFEISGGNVKVIHILSDPKIHLPEVLRFPPLHSLWRKNTDKDISPSGSSTSSSLSSKDLQLTREEQHSQDSLLRSSVGEAARRNIGSRLRPFMIAPVLEQIDSDQPLEYLTEMRRVTTMFVHVLPSAMSYDQLSHLVNDIYCTVTRLVCRALGCVNKVSCFDKDIMLLCIFGLRGFKHDQECRSGLRCGLSVRQAIICKPGVKRVSVGIATGNAYCGVVGHPMRREYTVIGASVNKAARMMCAYPHRVSCDKGTRFQSNLPSEFFILQESRPLKGIATAGPIYEYSEEHGQSATQIPRRLFQLPLLGQEQLMDQLQDMFHDIVIREPQRQILSVILEGKSGMGKSRVLYEVVSLARLIGLETHMVPLQHRHSTSAFAAMKYVFKKFVEHRQCSDIHDVITSTLKGVVPADKLSCLNRVFHLHFPDSHHSIDSIISTQQREETASVILAMLQKVTDPIFFAIDDLHLMDEQSWLLCSEVLNQLDKKGGNLTPILIIGSIAVHNALTAAYAKPILHNHFVKVKHLPGLGHDVMPSLACQLLGTRAVPKDVVQILEIHSRGNPGWCGSFLSALLRSEGLHILPMTISEMRSRSLILPPLQTLQEIDRRVIRVKKLRDDGSSLTCDSSWDLSSRQSVNSLIGSAEMTFEEVIHEVNESEMTIENQDTTCDDDCTDVYFGDKPHYRSSHQIDIPMAAGTSCKRPLRATNELSVCPNPKLREAVRTPSLQFEDASVNHSLNESSDQKAASQSTDGKVQIAQENSPPQRRLTLPKAFVRRRSVSFHESPGSGPSVASEEETWRRTLPLQRTASVSTTVSINLEEEDTEVKQACVLTPQFDGEETAASHVNGLIVSSFDYLPPYEQFVLKCGSALGDTFDRELLLHILNKLRPSSGLHAAQVIKGLFELHVLECASRTRAHDVKPLEQAINDETVLRSECFCSYTDEEKRMHAEENLSEYAYCKSLRFPMVTFRKAIYDLLPGNQKRNFHLEAVNYLENVLAMCEACKRSRQITTATVSNGRPSLDPNMRGSLKQLKDTKKFIDPTNLITNANFHHCECASLQANIYQQLIQHCAAAKNRNKLLHFMIEFGSVLILMGRAPEAIATLDEGEDLVRTALRPHDGKLSKSKKRRLLGRLGKLLTLKGQAYLALGNLESAHRFLLEALNTLRVPWPDQTDPQSKLYSKFADATLYFASHSEKQAWQWGFWRRLSQQEILHRAGCLALISNTYALKQVHLRSRAAAYASLYFARLVPGTCHIELCAAMCSVLESSMVYVKDRIETQAVEYFNNCARTATSAVYVRYLCRMLSDLFVYRFVRGDIGGACGMSGLVLQVTELIGARRAQIVNLPLVVRARLLGGEGGLTRAALRKLRAETELAIDDVKDSILTDYHTLYMDILLDGNESISSIECIKIVQEASNFVRQMHSNTQGAALRQCKIIVRLWLWYVRTNDWHGAATWENLASNDPAALLLPLASYSDWSALRLLEVLLITSAGRPSVRSSELHRKVHRLLSELKQVARCVPVILPRLMHLRAYWSILQGGWPRILYAVYQLQCATRLALKQGNVMESNWCIHSKKFWTGDDTLESLETSRLFSFPLSPSYRPHSTTSSELSENSGLRR